MMMILTWTIIICLVLVCICILLLRRALLVWHHVATMKDAVRRELEEIAEILKGTRPL